MHLLTQILWKFFVHLLTQILGKKFINNTIFTTFQFNSQQYDLHKNLCNKYFPTIKNSEIESEKEHPYVEHNLVT